MDDLSSLNLSDVNKMGRRKTTKGRGYTYTALEPEDAIDDVPNISEDEDSDQDTELSARISRKKWQSRLKANSSWVSWIWNGGCQLLIQRAWDSLVAACQRGNALKSRTVSPGQPDFSQRYPSNAICNRKYSLVSFIPKVLFEQFRFFLNLYFLVIAMTQFLPQLKIGYLYTYWGPLTFVIVVTMMRELYDDVKRYIRDKEVNVQQYYKLTKKGRVPVSSSDIQVSDVVIVEKDQRVPADMVLLRTTEKNGACFVRTDQLDGETDWKLRIAVASCQALGSDEDLFSVEASVFAEKPQKCIYNFVGTLSMLGGGGKERKEEPLGVENTLWANTILASGTALGLVIYTGTETRSVLNTSGVRSKVGLVDLEINRLTKILFVSMIALAIAMLALKGFSALWYVFLFRYVILFSYIIPISLRVNLDMGKVVYSWMIQRDSAIPDTVVRSSTIPEELGRIEFLLSDKTGTLTQNEMVFRKLHLGSVAFTQESMSELKLHLQFALSKNNRPSIGKQLEGGGQLVECVKALALCHNVTPVVECSGDTAGVQIGGQNGVDVQDTEVVVFQKEMVTPPIRHITYQASSPDEVALVKWTESVGLALVERDLTSLCLETPDGQHLRYDILQIFPFTSETKRMGIIVRDTGSGQIIFYMKGADVVMASKVQYNDWVEEECGNMAREGLRTLVVGKKVLTEDQYASFEICYKQAKLSVSDRASQVNAVLQSLEENMELLCLTGVEDQLQTDVRPTLELLRNAGIKVWMLTGDKMETATSIALSSRLIARTQNIYSFKQVSSRSEVHNELNSFRRKNDYALVISGDSLQLCLEHYEVEFVDVACQCPAVICCRCSPTHKAQIVNLLQRHTKRPVCAIGDGGNDVSMIQAANVGIGILGKEGKQASLAADFSITHFSHVSRLLVWHGRNCYKRSAALSQFVIHRGLIISVMQALFSAVFYFAAVPLYEGILMVGYATIYTMAPVFSMVLDEDVSPDIALMYPELYRELMKGRALSLKTFFVWVLISIYQGGVIMLLGFLLFEALFVHVVAITFTALVLNELLMVALTIRTWHGLMVLAQLFSIIVYVLSLVVLNGYFDGAFLLTFGFVWKTLLITAASCIPLLLLKLSYRKCAPPSYAKLLKQNSMFRNCCKVNC